MGVLLEVKNLGISFGGLRAVDGLNMTINEGALVGLIGPNGAGKTTAFNMLTGVYRPTDGTILLDGKSLVGKKPAEICQEGVARTFQNIRLFTQMSVLDNVKVALHNSIRYNLATSFLHLPSYFSKEKEMDEEAFEHTVKTGRMTYFSRSRQSQWIKGETSGHFQYVKSLAIDCDKDTLLAKVEQIGAACHTGNRSCFYTTIVGADYDAKNPLQIFESVYNTILDRKEHPKEGSYTNYLFDKGLDKILKKVGEEATEVVIAAKNPNPEEVKYELSDFLYHAMVLMAEKGITWDDITKELADR